MKKVSIKKFEKAEIKNNDTVKGGRRPDCIVVLPDGTILYS